LAGWFDGVLPTLVVTPETGDRFGWVTAAQTAQLAEVYGDGWRDDLGRELDTRWK
jgi:hypothetical protein